MKIIKRIGIITVLGGLAVGSIFLLRSFIKKDKTRLVMNSDQENVITVPFVDSDTDVEISDLPFDGEVFIEPLTENTFADETGKIGSLSISKLGLNVGVYKCEDEMEAMDKGVAHFVSTSVWDGNIGLSAHNVNFNGTDGYFKNLYKLKEGDKIVYETELGTRTYEVSEIREIGETDWSMFSHTDDNRLTLLTCISGKETKRLVIQATEIQNI